MQRSVVVTSLRAGRRRQGVLSIGIACVLAACGSSNTAPASGGSACVDADKADIYVADTHGTATISGTVTFSKTLPANTLIELGLKACSGAPGCMTGSPDDFVGTVSQRSPLKAAASSFTIGAVGLAVDQYLVYVRIDSNADGKIDATDSAGYFAGAGQQPALHRAAATEVTATGCNVDLTF